MEEDLRIWSAVRTRLEAAPVRRDEPTIPEVQQQDVSFLGPHAIAIFVSAIEMGVIIACFMRFVGRSDKEKTRIKALIYFLTFVAVCVRFFILFSFLDTLTPSNFLSHLRRVHHLPSRPWARTDEQAADGGYVRDMVEDLGGGLWQLGKSNPFFCVSLSEMNDAGVVLSDKPTWSRDAFLIMISLTYFLCLLMDSRRLQYLRGLRRFIHRWCALQSWLLSHLPLTDSFALAVMLA
jgi:hypothetical protein